MLIFVAKILWSTTHAPQNAYMGAPQKRFSLLVMLMAPFLRISGLFEGGVVRSNLVAIPVA
jgi:hypothetical protein